MHRNVFPRIFQSGVLLSAYCPRLACPRVYSEDAARRTEVFAMAKRLSRCEVSTVRVRSVKEGRHLLPLFMTGNDDAPTLLPSLPTPATEAASPAVPGSPDAPPVSAEAKVEDLALARSINRPSSSRDSAVRGISCPVRGPFEPEGMGS